jgi:RNA polymerase primary sigma factor
MDALQVYLTEIRRIPALSREEEIACLEHVRAGDEMGEESKKRLVEANLELVVSLAERYQSARFHIST